MSIFDTVEKIKIKKSNFDLSYQSLLTGKMGTLIPFLNQEVLPGDRFTINSNVFCRFLGLLSPVMSNVDITIHYWYCPNRILWKNWNDFIRAKDTGETEPAFPYLLFNNGVARSSLADYLGLPANTLDSSNNEVINLKSTEKVNALPFRAYAKIYNEFYRDEELQSEIGCDDGDGYDTTTNTTLQYRAWKKDYFTSARSQQQLGDGVTVPIGEEAPVIGNGTALGLTDGAHDVGVFSNNYGFTGVEENYGADVGDAVSGASGVTKDVAVGLTDNPAKSGVIADLSNASSIDIVKLRLAFQLQKFKERASRTGNRIKEFLLAHWGVKSSDARLQLPEYLGGSKNSVLFSEVIQTSESGTTPLGTLGGHGVAYNGKLQVKNKYFEEYGYVIGILNIQPKSSYCQGLHKKWFRQSQFDYPLPVFQHVGEQEILEKEILASVDDGEAIFGYAPRYAEYKHNQDEFHGDFCGNLSYYHLGRFFSKGVNDADIPKLNSTFIEARPSDRIFAVNSGVDNIIIQAQHNILARRKLDYFSNPGLVDHF